METGDTLTDALNYALEKQGGALPPVAVVNATGHEASSIVTVSDNACNKLENTLKGVFSTLLVRSTRQNDETLGLVALAAAHTAPDGKIIVAQENAHGAGGLEKHLRRAFPNLQTISKFKCRIMTLDRADADEAVLARWRDTAAIRKIKHNRGEFWSCPGLFSWDRPDPGSILLLAHLPSTLPGKGADLGCGNGLLSGAAAKKEGASEIWCLDADARAVECCRRNLEERGIAIPFHVLWRDATLDQPDIPALDWIVMNPPFHTQQDESRELGQRFCNSAMKMLRSGGELYLVANRHMPYEAVLEKDAAQVNVLADTDGFKILRARKK